MSHTHHHENLSDSRLLFAIALNLSLTLVEVVGGMISGSLSLVADALHNFSDCTSLFIALIARRVARRQADEHRTFGYRRAEVIGALINLTTLVLMALYLLYGAFERYFQPEEIRGWTVINVAAFALVVDIATVILLRSLSQGSINVRAAALHNLSDALASVGVMIVGVSVLLWNLNILDVLVTLMIAGYILWQSVTMLRATIHILMESVPADLNLYEIQTSITDLPAVQNVHHMHAWQLDEHQRAFEAHIVISAAELNELERIKEQIKTLLKTSFNISHSTLEFEVEGSVVEHDNTLIPVHFGDVH